MPSRMPVEGVLRYPRPEKEETCVSAPSIDGIEIRLPVPKAVSTQELTGALEELRVRHAERIPKEEGEEAEMGDEVWISCVGYHNTRLLPGSFYYQTPVILDNDNWIPGFCKRLVGLQVGRTRSISMQLPDDYPVVRLREKQAHFTVKLHRAYRIDIPELESTSFLKRVGWGDSLEDVMEVLHQRLIQKKSEDLAQLSKVMVLEELIKRTETRVSEQAIDLELIQSWQKMEGQFMHVLEIAEKDQLRALSHWMASEENRVISKKRLAISQILWSIAESKQEDRSTGGFKDFMESLVEDCCIGLEEEQKEPDKRDLLAQLLGHSYMHFSVLNYVMSKSTIHYA